MSLKSGLILSLKTLLYYKCLFNSLIITRCCVINIYLLFKSLNGAFLANNLPSKHRYLAQRCMINIEATIAYLP